MVFLLNRALALSLSIEEITSLISVVYINRRFNAQVSHALPDLRFPTLLRWFCKKRLYGISLP